MKTKPNKKYFCSATSHLFPSIICLPLVVVQSELAQCFLKQVSVLEVEEGMESKQFQEAQTCFESAMAKANTLWSNKRVF